ncbi:MAG: hypothetical protein H0X26_06030 [Alphaproteobacteria bacterium]|nr:hypothetical protein [Alphaproteobacteria bacterium]
MITLKISDLINPLEGTFCLSEYGDTGKYLSISTGHRKGNKPENYEKLEICLAPKFTIAKNVKLSADYLQPIMGDWNEETAPIGIFWTLGACETSDGYDYLTNKPLNNISSKNLFENWSDLDTGKVGASPYTPDIFKHISGHAKKFMFICKPE